MLKLDNVSKNYGELVAVDKLSFEVKPGEIFGLLGLNGAGKTTTFRMILNLFKPNEGTIYYNDKPMDYDQSDSVGFLSEERSLLTKMTVRDQVIYYARLKGISEPEIVTSLKYWLERLNVPEYENKKIKELSKGNQQKIQFISAIVHNPKLLILDEPFSGLDPINVELFKEVILELKEKGTAIIFSSHRMEHVEMFCEKLVVLVKGKNILSGYISDIKDSYERQNIVIRGTVDAESLRKVDGVVEVITHQHEVEVKIKNRTYVKNVFDATKESDDISLFDVRLPSLNEIFIAKVGESYE